ncbi:MAG: glycosyltransferase family 4 protein [Candidatus Azobacteroides sp.]|nr:glycosyltransferase family 4 protein [Candidatus Azobacteroides sp.]
MRILHICDYISINEDPEFSRNISGYGYMVLCIAKSISALHDIENLDLLTLNCFTKGRKIDEVQIVKRNIMDLLKDIKIKYIFRSIGMLLRYRPNFFWSIRIFFYYLSLGHVESIIKNGKYDLIHFHGIDFLTESMINYCKKHNMKFLVTLHGLYSFHEETNVTWLQIKNERNFLKRIIIDEIPVTVISTGIKNVILNYLNANVIDCIHIVPNGTDIEYTKYNNINIRNLHNIREEEKIMLCVGNISERKNQLQIVRAYRKLEEKIRNKLIILFLGINHVTDFEVEIKQNGMKNRLILCGNISKDILPQYYSQANYTILTSISEGFGLSIIEGFVFGLPNLTFSDLAAIPDIFDPQAMFLIDNRDDDSLTKGIAEFIQIKWDSEYIKQYSRNFSLEKMAKNYSDIYKKIIQ